MRSIRPKHACQKVEPRVLWCLLIGCAMAEERNGGPVRHRTTELLSTARNLCNYSTYRVLRQRRGRMVVEKEEGTNGGIKRMPEGAL